MIVSECSEIFFFNRKNEVATFSEVEKLKRLPMLRALILRR